MRVIRSKDFTATRAWGADDIANMGGTTTRLHWTDQPYKWHVNDVKRRTKLQEVGCGRKLTGGFRLQAEYRDE